MSSPHIPHPLVRPNKESGLFPCGVSSSSSAEIIYKRTVFTTHFQRTRRGTVLVVLLPSKPSIALTLGGPQHFDSCTRVQRALLSVPKPQTLPRVLCYRDGQNKVPVLKAPHQAFSSQLVSSSQGDCGPRAHSTAARPVAGFCKRLQTQHLETSPHVPISCPRAFHGRVRVRGPIQ